MNGSQLLTMLWLRWRLTCNQWRRGGGLGAVVAILLLVLGVGLSLLGGAVGLSIGALALPRASADAMMFAWDALVGIFLFFWMIGLVMELQRSELIDYSRLLHLPVSLRGVFSLNYLASHLSFSIVTMLSAMLGVTAGLVLRCGPAMLLLVPLVLAFFLMITAWTYCLRGWLASLMVNKRRRRAIVVGITMAMVLLFQLPNLLTNVWLNGGPPPRKDAPPAEFQKWLAQRADRGAQTDAFFRTAHRYVPLLWLPAGAKSLKEFHAGPALWGALGMALIGAAGLVQAYRSTLRFYRGGHAKKRAPAPARAPTAAPARPDKRLLVERSLPAVPEEAAAMAMATLRGMSRAPEVKMGLATNVIIFVILGLSSLLRGGHTLPAAARPFVASAAVAVAILGLAQLMFNQFGFDRSGFRSLVLLPSPRRYVLLGKNLALGALAALMFAVYLVLATALAQLRVWDILAAVIEFAGAMAALCILGNLTSILAPYRISAGSLKPTKIKGTTQLRIFVAAMFVPVTLSPVFLPAAAGWLFSELTGLPAMPVTLAGAVLLTALALLLYWQTLAPLARLFERREQAILQIVTQEVE